MRTLLGGKGVMSMVVLLTQVALGCDWLPLNGEWPSSPQPSSQREPASDAGTTTSGNYDAMCLHYCEALQETDVLACASSGREVAACVAAAPATTACFDLRCRPQLVDLSRCLSQCDALASQYDSRCPAAGDASDPLCPSSQADHDKACRAGCVL